MFFQSATNITFFILVIVLHVIFSITQVTALSSPVNKFSLRPILPEPSSYGSIEAACLSSFPQETTTTTSSTMTSSETMIASSCQCGALQLRFPSSSVTTSPDGSRTAAVDCHCPSCRKYHVSAFACYVQVLKQNVTIIGSEAAAESYRDYCTGGLGVPGGAPIAMNRVHCKHCSSKMYSEPIRESNKNLLQWQSKGHSNDEILLINMGPLHDESIPVELAQQWREQKPTLQPLAASQKSMEQRIIDAKIGRMQWKVMDTAAWTWSLPRYDRMRKNVDKNNDDDNSNDDEDDPIFPPQPIHLKGGCTCGACQYEINFQAPSELQHCYCRLCRQLSGGPFMTWIPVPLEDFRWTTVPPPNPDDRKLMETTTSIIDTRLDPSHLLVRYTNHGQRHVCPTCRNVMTIQYDEDSDKVIWPAAATMDTIHLPSVYKAVDLYLDRVMHICCSSKQSWYELPDDHMPRINDAS